MRSAWQKWPLLGRLFFCLHVLSNILVNKVCCQSNNLFISHQNTINMHPKSFPSPIFISHYVSELINQLVQYQHQPLRFLPDAHHFFSINYRIISVDNNKMTKLPCLLSRPRWSRGNVLASGSKVRGFKPDWGQWIFSGRKNPEHKFSGRDLSRVSRVWDFRLIKNLELEKIRFRVKFNRLFTS